MAKVLVIGSGAREHAICTQFQQSSVVTQVYCAPGNPGMMLTGVKTVAIDELEFAQLINFVKKEHIDLTFVGPEVPLQRGIVDEFHQANLPIFGPTKDAAQLESSKHFAKVMMTKAKVPTAKYQAFTNEKDALEALNQWPFPLVIKANGLAAGKGVVIAQDKEVASQTVHQMLGEHEFNTTEIIFEEFLSGQEFSFMAFVSGDQIVPMPLSQDHKAAFDGDEGPNTGGMGAYSPLPQFDQSIADTCLSQIINPIVATMNASGCPFQGILYAGLILTNEGPKVIEFNVRFGDPETAVLLPQLQTDFYDLITCLIKEQPCEASWQTDEIYLTVVLSGSNYPEQASPDTPLTFIKNKPAQLVIDYAGVTEDPKHQLISHGGRIMDIVSHGDNVASVQRSIYQWLDAQKLTNLRYRHDIGNKAIKA